MIGDNNWRLFRMLKYDMASGLACYLISKLAEKFLMLFSLRYWQVASSTGCHLYMLCFGYIPVLLFQDFKIPLNSIMNVG